MIVGIELHATLKLRAALERNLQRIGLRGPNLQRSLRGEHAALTHAESVQEIQSGDHRLDLKFAGLGIRRDVRLHQTPQLAARGEKYHADTGGEHLAISAGNTAAQSECRHAGHAEIEALQSIAGNHR